MNAVIILLFAIASFWDATSTAIGLKMGGSEAMAVGGWFVNNFDIPGLFYLKAIAIGLAAIVLWAYTHYGRTLLTTIRLIIIAGALFAVVAAIHNSIIIYNNL